MKVADPRATGRHIFICDFCGLSSLGFHSSAFPGLVLAENGESCICRNCAVMAVEISDKPAPAQEPGHA